jgi:bacillopeptidase F
MRRGIAFATMAAAVGLTISACGSSSSGSSSSPDDKQTTPAAATTEQPHLKVVLTAPADGQKVTGKTVVVRGTVTPASADVMVLGHRAKVTSGVFQRKISLDTGDNHIDVVATMGGADPATTTIDVTRKAPAVHHAKKKANKQPAPAPQPTTVAVPNEIGERLDVAKDDLASAGLGSKEIGGGTFGVVVESNWTVCETKPAPGAQVEKGTRVKLIIDREC